MQPGAHGRGYSTDGSYASKLRAPVQRRPEAPSNECNRGSALLEEILADRCRLSPKMHNLADFCLRNAHALHRMRILDLADEADTIPSTVVRFAKRYGFVGFHDFKLAFLQESSPDSARQHHVPVGPKPAGMQAALWELDIASASMLALKDLVSTTSFQQAVRWTKAAGLVGILARSVDDRPVAMHLEFALNRLGKATIVLSERQYLQGDFAARADVLFDIDIGLGDRSTDYGRVLPTAMTRFVRMTASPSSAFSTNVMSHLGLFSYADFPEHLTLAGIALMNALSASLRE